MPFVHELKDIDIILLKSFSVRRRPIRFHIIVTNPGDLAVSLFLFNCNHQNNQTRTEEKIEKNAKRDRRTELRVEEKKRGKKQGWYEENEARGGEGRKDG